MASGSEKMSKGDKGTKLVAKTKAKARKPTYNYTSSAPF